jgi:NADH-quinone oxidoreductase subunit G
VLRALADELAVPGFEFTDLAGLRAGIARRDMQAAKGKAVVQGGNGLEVALSQAIYRSDATVRRANALQAHPLTSGARVVLNPADAASAALAEGAMAKLGNGVGTATLQVVVDDRVAPGCAWIESGYGATAPLAASATLEVARA